MGSGFSNPLIGGGGALVYPSIHSPNFNEATQTGWAINKDGSAFFFTIDAAKELTVHNVFGAVVMKVTNAGFFQYFDNQSAVQGALILVIASVAGNDPVNGTAYQPGMTGIDPVFGDSINTVGANIALSQVAFTRPGKIGSFTGAGSACPQTRVEAPEQGAAGRLQMLLCGTSPDLSRPGGLVVGEVTGSGVLAKNTDEVLEVQGAAVAQQVNAFAPGGFVTEETWHTVSAGLPAGWAGAFNYRLLATGDVAVEWNFTIISGTAVTDGETILAAATLPAAYRPAAGKFFAGLEHVAAGSVYAFLQVNNAGAVLINGPGSSTVTSFAGSGRYALGV